MDGPLALQIKRSERKERRKFLPLHTTRSYTPSKPPELAANNALLNNGLGGYSEKAHEYIIHLTEEMATPAPWVNVLANANFGTIVSESGQSYTWDINAHEFRITPWENDPVSDVSGEAFYMRDEETGHYWSPTPLPCRGTATMSAATDSATVFSNTSKTVSVPNSGFTWLWKTASSIPC